MQFALWERHEVTGDGLLSKGHALEAYSLEWLFWGGV